MGESYERTVEIYNKNHCKIRICSRFEAHRLGLLHQVVHCWVLDRSGAEWWIYLQQRAFDKKDFPGLYEISASGHVDPGETAEQAVIREVQEEIGLTLNPSALHYLGEIEEELRFGDLIDREISQVYLYDCQNPRFHPGEEVERIVRVSFEEFLRWIEEADSRLSASLVPEGKKVLIAKEEICIHSKEYFSWLMSRMISFVKG